MLSNLQDFSEQEQQHAFGLQNHKLLKVKLAGGETIARAGSMVAYQGAAEFTRIGSGSVKKMVKKGATGEGMDMMKISGDGEVFLADTAQNIHVIYLNDDFITCNAKNLLAFQASIQWDIKRVKTGSAMIAGGLFNMELRGTGFVAVTTDGAPVLLDVASAPTFADPQAAVLWSSGVTTSVSVQTGGAMSMLRGGSGETFRMAFGGQGWVLVQPSEGRGVLAEGGKAGLVGFGLGTLLPG